VVVLAAEVSALLVVMKVVGEKDEEPTASALEAKEPTASALEAKESLVVSGLRVEVSQSLSVPKSYPYGPVVSASAALVVDKAENSKRVEVSTDSVAVGVVWKTGVDRIEVSVDSAVVDSVVATPGVDSQVSEEGVGSHEDSVSTLPEVDSVPDTSPVLEVPGSSLSEV
jgi:hypothetical protein